MAMAMAMRHRLLSSSSSSSSLSSSDVQDGVGSGRDLSRRLTEAVVLASTSVAILQWLASISAM